MALEIILSSEAKETISAIILFVRQQWGVTSAEKFVASAYRKLDLISINPYMYKSMEDLPNSRIALVNPHVSVVYEIHPNHIYILYFWDNRQQPII